LLNPPFALSARAKMRFAAHIIIVCFAAKSIQSRASRQKTQFLHKNEGGCRSIRPLEEGFFTETVVSDY